MAFRFTRRFSTATPPINPKWQRDDYILTGATMLGSSMTLALAVEKCNLKWGNPMDMIWGGIAFGLGGAASIFTTIPILDALKKHGKYFPLTIGVAATNAALGYQIGRYRLQKKKEEWDKKWKTATPTS